MSCQAPVSLSTGGNCPGGFVCCESLLTHYAAYNKMLAHLSASRQDLPYHGANKFAGISCS
jgi:hypothetical protein